MSSTVNVEALAKSTLGLEDSSRSAPPLYVNALSAFLKTNPNDQHFIMELGEEGKSCGGNGYGSVTCMEDYCWEDIILDPESTLPLDMQKRQGLGSLFNFRVHCQKPAHIKGRNERCNKEGITIQKTIDPFESSSTSPYTSTTNRPASQSAQAGPSSSGSAPARSTASGSGRNLVSLLDDIDHPAPAPRPAAAPRQPTVPSLSQSTLSSQSRSEASSSRAPHTHAPNRISHSANIRSAHPHALDPLNVNAPTLRPPSMSQGNKQKQPTAPSIGHTFIMSDDDDDDDIEEIVGSRVPPGMRKGREAPIVVHDSRPTSMSRQPGSNDSTLSSSSSVQEVKPKVEQVHRSSRPALPTPGSTRPALPTLGSSRSALPTSDISLSRATDTKPKLIQIMKRDDPAAHSNTNDGAMPSLTCCQPSRQEVWERYEKEARELRAWQRRGPTIDSARVRHRIAQIASAMSLLHTEPGRAAQWEAPSREVLKAIPALSNHVTLWQQSDLIKSRQHYLHAGVGRPSSSMSSRPQNAQAGPSSSAAQPYASLPSRYGLPHDTKFEPGMLQNMPGAFPSNIPPYQLPAFASYPMPGLPGVPGLPGMTNLIPGMDFDDMYDIGREFDRPDNLQEFFTSAMNSFDEDQDVEGALKYLKINDLQEKFRDLAITLMPHQVLSVKFMIEQEKNNRMKGGILADSMGLGKTVSTIATIAGNPSEDRKVKTTLVVAPLALLQQWKSEIETKTTSQRKVLIHWGPKRTTSAAQLKQYDVVLTTYGILTTEHGKDKKPKKGKKKERLQDDETDESDDDIPVISKQGPLFKAMWYRVVLDEAHIIRNRQTRASQAACDLNTNFRWCLTGTPVVNSLCDLYPLLHFLRISPQRDWKEFNAHIGRIEKRKPNLATKRAQAILKTCSMRRNKESTLNGVRLLNLPDKVVTWDELVLSPEERHIYDSIEKRMQVKFNSLLKRGTVLKHYSMVLVMLIRLKQATAHPFLLTRRPEDALHPDDVVISDEELMGTRDAALVDDMKELQRALDLLGQEYVTKVEQKLEERWKLVASKAQDVKNDKDAVDDTECAICFEPFEHEHAERITQCLHSFCATCTEELFNAEPRTADLTEAQQAKGMRQCPMCREPIDREKIFRASAFFNPEEQADDVKPQFEIVDGKAVLGKRSSEGESEDVKPALKKLQTGKGKGKAVDKEDKKDEKPEKPVPVDIQSLEITPSTKMKRLCEIIEEKLAADPTCKVVAYSQFTSFLDLCGSYLRTTGTPNLQYQGSMQAKERQDVLDQFNKPTDQPGGENRVLLLSLKAGGVGLNLTISNVVVALDLAWNAATEDQAVDRCHRIGQTKEVDVRRLVTANTIDARIKALQDTKRGLADGALGEGEGGKLGRLSIGDLIRLFNVDGSGEDA